MILKPDMKTAIHAAVLARRHDFEQAWISEVAFLLNALIEDIEEFDFTGYDEAYDYALDVVYDEIAFRQPDSQAGRLSHDLQQLMHWFRTCKQQEVDTPGWQARKDAYRSKERHLSQLAKQPGEEEKEVRNG